MSQGKPLTLNPLKIMRKGRVIYLDIDIILDR
jgi:hypothetical protein